MRAFLAGLAGTLAVLLLPVALVAFWANQTVANTDLFVQEMAPVVQQPQVQQALTDGATQAALDAANLRPAVQRLVEPTVRSLAASAVASPAVATAWSSGIRVAHGQAIRILRGEADTGVDAQGRVVLHLTIPIPPLTAVLEKAGVPNAAAIVPIVDIPLVSADQLRQAQRGYRVLVGWGPLWAVIVAVLALLSVALARRWDRATLLVGLGGLVMCGLFALVITQARDPLLSGVSPPTARAIADAAYSVAAQGIQSEIWVAAAVSFVLVVVAVGLRLLARPGQMGRIARGSAR